MANPNDEDRTPQPTPAFDFDAYPSNTCFYDRRTGLDRRDRAQPTPPAARSTVPQGERRAKKERRRRIDPTTFEKQYTVEELEFMTAMQRFKVQSGRSFPTYSEVLRVAASLGYRKVPRLAEA